MQCENQFVLTVTISQNFLETVLFSTVKWHQISHWKHGLFGMNYSYINRMQIWGTTRSSPGTSYMKARLVSLRWFVLKMLPQKTLALSSICSVLFRCAYELLCFWMRQEGIEIFHRSPLRENNGSMQFVETEKRSSRSPRELKFVCYVSG